MFEAVSESCLKQLIEQQVTVEYVKFLCCKITNSTYPHYYIAFKILDTNLQEYSYMRYDRFNDGDRMYHSSTYADIVAGLRSCDHSFPIRQISKLSFQRPLDLKTLHIMYLRASQHPFSHQYHCHWICKFMWGKILLKGDAIMMEQPDCWHFEPQQFYAVQN